MAEVREQIADFHVRLGRMEKVLEQRNPALGDSWREDLAEIIAGAVALICCGYGIGAPNHYYQYLFALVTLACLYHRGTIPFPKNAADWLLLGMNIALVSILFKVIIGGGEPRPLAWLSYPTIEGGVTSFKVSWQSAPGSGWILPLTSIQSFFLVVSLFAMMIELSLLAGLTTFALTLLALPSLFSFDWDWALPGMVIAIFCFYLQIGSFAGGDKYSS